MSVIVVGAGIAGLGVARMLSRAGLSVKLVEAAPEAGGLGAMFQTESGAWVEKFYHCLLPGDAELLGLIDDYGLRDQVRMNDGSLAFIYGGRHYSLASAVDLLKFRPLGFVQKARLGMLAWHARPAASMSASDLDRITVREWLRRVVGEEVLDRLWRPLLEAKFGDAWAGVPALWLQSTLSREKNHQKEIKGVLLGGLRPLVLALLDDLAKHGVELRTNFPVNSVRIQDAHVEVSGPAGSIQGSRVVLAVPVNRAQAMLSQGGVHSWLEGQRYDHQGVVCGVFMLDRPLTRRYWTAVVDSGVPFQGIVEMSVLRPPEDLGGRHLVYVMNYTHRTSDIYRTDDATTIAAYTAGLVRLFPELKDGGIRESYVFRTPEVEPVYTPGFLERRPPVELVPSRAYLVNVSQVYPGVTSWNSSLKLARRAADWILAREKFESPHAPRRERVFA